MRRVIAIGLIVFFPAIALSQQPTPSPLPQNTVSGEQQRETPRAKTQTDPEQRDAKISPSFLKIENSGYTEGKPSNNRDNGLNNESKGWGIGDKIAVWAVAVGLLQFVALAYTVNVMVSTGRRQLRAYVSINPTEVFHFGSTEIIQIQFATKNHGQTPASGINYVFEVAVFPTPIPVDLFATADPSIAVNAETTLFPGYPMITWVNGPRLLALQEVVDIKGGTKALCVWGKLFYKDSFGDDRTTLISASVCGESFAKHLAAVKAKAKEKPGYTWSYGTNHNQAT